jgi:hypothetical protein
MKQNYANLLGEIGLVEICDVCGRPLLKDQKLGKRKSNDALCHDKCLYYKIGSLILTKKSWQKTIICGTKYA